MRNDNFNDLTYVFRPEVADLACYGTADVFLMLAQLNHVRLLSTVEKYMFAIWLMSILKSSSLIYELII